MNQHIDAHGNVWVSGVASSLPCAGGEAPPTHGKRRAEVEVELGKVYEYRSAEEIPIHLNQVARTLADEIDVLTAENERIKQNHGCARHQHTTQFCAEAAAKDVVIGRLLRMLGREIGDYPYDSLKTGNTDGRVTQWEERFDLHARACEIAGRKPE